MNRTLTVSALACTVCAAVCAREVLWVATGAGSVKDGFDAARVERVEHTADKSGMTVRTSDGLSVDYALGSLWLGEADDAVKVTFSGGTASVENALAADGVKVTVDGAMVTVTSDAPFAMTVTGTTTNGQIKTYGKGAPTIRLENASIENASGSAINIQTKNAQAVIEVEGSVTLGDAETYATPDGEKENGTIHSQSALTIGGTGTLTVTGRCKHGINGQKDLDFRGPLTVNVASSASDGIHCDGVNFGGGVTVTVANAASDCVDASANLTASDATLGIEVSAADAKGLKADGDIELLEGTKVTMTLTGDQSKGIKAKGAIRLSGADIEGTATGNCVVTDGDPSYCSFIKSDGDLEVSGATAMRLTHNGKGGKGISADGNATFAGTGEIAITCTGNGEVYTDTSGQKDYYTSTCITVDGELKMESGTFTLANSGTAGKCIKSDGDAFFGTSGTADGPAITARTTGSRYTVSTASGGGMGGWRPGGNMENGEYANPKVVKGDGNVTVYGGSMNLSSASDGGEGLESKATLTIAGGTIVCSTVDDCINAATHLQIDGGTVYCLSSGNDGMDSNGTIAIGGGVVVSCTSKGGAETGIDNDGRQFKLTGGIVVCAGAGNDKPTGSVSTQRSVCYGASVSKGSMLTVCDPSGKHLLSFTAPCANLSSFLISHPGMTGGTHTLYTGGTAQPGESYPQLVVNGNYTPGTSAATFTPTTSCATAGSGGSTPGGTRP